MFYFAYGSNIHTPQMVARLGAKNVGVVGLARLEGYQLAFAGRSSIWQGGAVATILDDSMRSIRTGCQNPGSAENCTHGLLYSVNPKSIAKLDRYEGSAYERINVKVWHNGVKVDAFTYMMPEPELGPPCADYVHQIIKGCNDNMVSLESLRFALRHNIGDFTLVGVYGSLRKGLYNHYMLRDSRHVLTDRVQGELYDMGAFPGLSVTDRIGADAVVEVYAVDAETLDRLDRLERHPVWYERQNTKTIDAGVLAQVYYLPQKYIRGRFIHCNDWLKYTESQTQMRLT